MYMKDSFLPLVECEEISVRKGFELRYMRGIILSLKYSSVTMELLRPSKNCG